MYTVEEIARLTGCRFEGKGDRIVNGFITDSRSVRTGTDVAFVALRTARNDGHRFIPGLLKEGVRAFFVSADFDRTALGENVSVIICDDTLKAFQRLAAAHRTKFTNPVMAITGSNGKTGVKEWLYHLLKPDYEICRSPKSYNSQVGVALSLLHLGPEHTMGIFEAGISEKGEMEKLEEMIRPTLGILTHIGSAHDEGFTDRSEKIREKTKLFRSAETVILNGIDSIPAEIAGVKNKFLINGTGDHGVRCDYGEGRFTIHWKNNSTAFTVPFTDKASLQNAATCVVTMLHLGYDTSEIKSRLESLPVLSLRLESHRGILNARIISDYYNSDLDALKIALDYLRRQSRGAKKVAVLSDIGQSGLSAEKLYGEISKLVKAAGVDLLIGIGTEIGKSKEFFRNDSMFFENTAAFVREIASVKPQIKDAVVLLKGARDFGFEQIDRALQAKTHDTVLEINLEAITDNVNYYRSLISPRVKMMCMVKAGGYGSGGTDIAAHLQNLGVEYLAVAYADEGVELRESGISLPVMVMSPEIDAMDDLIAHNLEPEIYSPRILHAFVQALERNAVAGQYPVHVKIDTGMNRLGFSASDIDSLSLLLKENAAVKVVSAFTHLAGSDNAALDEFTHHQISTFKPAAAKLKTLLGYDFMLHATNSAGVSRFKDAHFDMVRIGIGLYGISSNDKEQSRLQCAASLKTRISQIKKLSAGDTVGYNRAGVATQNMVIATIPIGYADGFSRLLGNGKHGVYIRRKFCKTVGSICMDMCMVDITDVECSEGDEVVVFSDAEQLKSMATALGTIPYEVLTNVSARVRRIYLG